MIYRIFSFKNSVLFFLVLFIISCQFGDTLFEHHKPVAVKAETLTNSLPSSLSDYQDNVVQYRTASQSGEMNILIIEALSPESADTIIFLNGLSQVIPDWPPVFIEKLVGQYNLLFMDYPGIGGTEPIKGKGFNYINIANSLNGILDLFPNEYSNITGKAIHLVGWSLGTLVALKSIEPLSHKRKVKNVVLFATKPGGEGGVPLGSSFGNAAPCVKSIAAELSEHGMDWYGHFARKLKRDQFLLLFPYKAQTVLDSTAAYIDCMASSKEKTLSVELDPRFKHEYEKIGWQFLKNRLGGLWDGGIPNDVYNQERKTVSDWDRFSELDKHYHFDNDTGNDAICKTLALTKQRVASVCPDLSQKVSSIKVVHAKKDLFMQYHYGQSLVDALNAASPNIATITLFDDAGHAYFLQESYQLTPSMFE